MTSLKNISFQKKKEKTIKYLIYIRFTLRLKILLLPGSIYIAANKAGQTTSTDLATSRKLGYLRDIGERVQQVRGIPRGLRSSLAVDHWNVYPGDRRPVPAPLTACGRTQSRFEISKTVHSQFPWGRGGRIWPPLDFQLPSFEIRDSPTPIPAEGSLSRDEGRHVRDPVSPRITRNNSSAVAEIDTPMYD